MEPPNTLSTETKLNLGKQKKDAGDQAFRQGGTKEGMHYMSNLVLVTEKFSAMKQYHEVTRISNFLMFSLFADSLDRLCCIWLESTSRFLSCFFIAVF